MAQDHQKTVYIATNNQRHNLYQRGMYRFFVSDEGAGIEASTNLQWANKQTMCSHKTHGNPTQAMCSNRNYKHTRQTDCVHECQHENWTWTRPVCQDPDTKPWMLKTQHRQESLAKHCAHTKKRTRQYRKWVSGYCHWTINMTKRSWHICVLW